MIWYTHTDIFYVVRYNSFFIYHIHLYIYIQIMYVFVSFPICYLKRLVAGFSHVSSRIFLHFSSQKWRWRLVKWLRFCVWSTRNFRGEQGRLGMVGRHVGIQSFCCHFFGDDGVWIIKSISTEWGCFIDWYWLFSWYCHWMILWKYTSTLYEARLNTPHVRNYKWHNWQVYLCNDMIHFFI